MRKMILGVALLALTTIVGCGGEGTQSSSGGGRGTVLMIAAGSENEQVFFTRDADGHKVETDRVQRFERENGVDLQVELLGSVDIMHEVELGTNSKYDAVFAAANVWIALGNEKSHAVKEVKTIYQSPVVLGVLPGTARTLGWLDGAGKPIVNLTVDRILSAAEEGVLRFAMTTPTRSNSGNATFMSFMYAFAEHPDVLTLEEINKPAVAEKMRRILKAQHRKSASSGWLKTLYVEQALKGGSPFNAMFNYESLIIEANQELVQKGLEPFYVFYVMDGLAIADSPLGYVDKGDAGKRKAFDALQTWLLSDESQRELVRMGRRPAASLAMKWSDVDRSVWNPAWGVDVERILSPFPMPEPPVIRAAMELYGLSLRPPVLQVLVLDYSSSMGTNGGDAQLKQSCDILLDPVKARENMLFIGPRDKTIVIPFDSSPRNADQLARWTVDGNDARALARLNGLIQAEEPGGDTDMYAPVLLAFKAIKALGPAVRGYKISVIVMSDGESNQGNNLAWLQAEMRKSGVGGDTPVYTMLFGSASKEQMEPLASAFGGRMLDGRKDFIGTFKEVLSYNQ